jgi:hypothetical protein
MVLRKRSFKGLTEQCAERVHGRKGGQVTRLFKIAHCRPSPSISYKIKESGMAGISRLARIRKRESSTRFFHKGGSIEGLGVAGRVTAYWNRSFRKYVVLVWAGFVFT